MDVLAAIFRFPFYSIAKRSYQVRASLVLPSPSALKGALAKGISLLTERNGDKLDDIAKEIIKELESKLVYVSAKPYRSAIVKNPILLKRLRNLEPYKSKPKTQDEWEKYFTKDDAMRREYTFARELLAIYVFKELSEEKKELFLKAVYLIDQLGDTESVGCVVKAGWFKLKSEKSPLKLYTELDKLKSENIIGEFIVEGMLKSPSFGGKIEERPYLIPLVERHYKRTTYYVETEDSLEGNYKLEAFGEVMGLWI